MNRTVKPITPEEAGFAKAGVLPVEVLKTWNEMIIVKVSNGVARITQDQIIAALMKTTGVEREAVFKSGWLEIEDLYRAVGWDVDYDKPGYNESYQPIFTFSKGKK